MIEIYVLENCLYSQKALSILDKFDFKYRVIFVKQNEKQYYKKKNKYETFPQIFLIKSGKNKKDKKCIKLGGASELEHYIEISHLIKYNDIPMSKLREFLKLYQL